MACFLSFVFLGTGTPGQVEVDAGVDLAPTRLTSALPGDEFSPVQRRSTTDRHDSGPAETWCAARPDRPRSPGLRYTGGRISFAAHAQVERSSEGRTTLGDM